LGRSPSSSLFPYTTLFRSIVFALEQLGSRAEMANVGHAATNEDLIDNGAGDIRQAFDIVGVVGASHQRLVDFIEIDFNDSGVFGDRKSTRLNSSHVSISYA